MTVRVTRLEVAGDPCDGGTTCSLEGIGFEDDVRLTWSCGDSATFTAEGLAAAVEHVKQVAVAFPGVRARITDVLDSDVTVWVEDDRLHVQDGHGWVPWSDLRKAIRRMLESVGD